MKEPTKTDLVSNDEAFVNCACHGEGLHIEFDNADALYYISLWQKGLRPDKLSWRQRVRYIFRLLIKGKPYGDEVILNKVEANKLSAFIDKHLMSEGNLE